MYYYPYFLQFLNLFSFRHYNNVDEESNKTGKIDLWSISRWSYSKYKGTATFTASYNYCTKNYEFCGEHFISYDDVVNRALIM